MESGVTPEVADKSVNVTNTVDELGSDVKNLEKNVSAVDTGTRSGDISVATETSDHPGFQGPTQNLKTVDCTPGLP